HDQALREGLDAARRLHLFEAERAAHEPGEPEQRVRERGGCQRRPPTQLQGERLVPAAVQGPGGGELPSRVGSAGHAYVGGADLQHDDGPVQLHPADADGERRAARQRRAAVAAHARPALRALFRLPPRPARAQHGRLQPDERQHGVQYPPGHRPDTGPVLRRRDPADDEHPDVPVADAVPGAARAALQRDLQLQSPLVITLRRRPVKAGRRRRFAPPKTRSRARPGLLVPPKLGPNSPSEGGAIYNVQCMTIRQQIAEMLKQPRTMSSIAHELKLTTKEVEDHLKHLIKTARAADQDIRVEPARCRSCGYTFAKDKINKPSKCPECKGTRLYEPLVQIKT